MSSDLETRLSFTSLHFAGKRSTGRGPAPGRPLPPLGGGRSFGVRRSTPIFQNRGKQPLPTTTPKLLSIKARLSLSLSCLLACSALSPPPCAQRYSFLRAARSKSRNLLYARRRTGLLGELCCAALLSSFLPSAGEESANRLGPRPPPPYLVGGRRPWSLWSGLFPAAVPSSSLSLSLSLVLSLRTGWHSPRLDLGNWSWPVQFRGLRVHKIFVRSPQSRTSAASWPQPGHPRAWSQVETLRKTSPKEILARGAEGLMHHARHFCKLFGPLTVKESLFRSDW